MQEQPAYVIVTKHDPTKHASVQWEAYLYEYGDDLTGNWDHYEPGADEHTVVSAMQAYIAMLQIVPEPGGTYLTDDTGEVLDVKAEGV